jgi:hypothetical protein
MVGNAEVVRALQPVCYANPGSILEPNASYGRALSSGTANIP